MITKLIHENKAIISIEIAFVLMNVLIILFAILEFSLIYSIRSGLEEISRDIARENLSTSGGSDFSTALAGNGSLTKDEYFTNLIHSKITSIVLKPENVEMCVKVVFNITQLLFAPTAPTCQNFNANVSTKPTPYNWGQAGEFIEVTITYRHEALTPLGSIISAVQNIDLKTLSYTQREGTFVL